MLWASAWSLEKELQIVVWQEAIESISSIYAKHNSREIGVSRKRASQYQDSHFNTSHYQASIDREEVDMKNHT